MGFSKFLGGLKGKRRTGVNQPIQAPAPLKDTSSSVARVSSRILSLKAPPVAPLPRPAAPLSKNTPSSWSRAYKALRDKDPQLVVRYEKILSKELQENSTTATRPQELDQSENRMSAKPDERLTQLEAIIEKGLQRADEQQTKYTILGHDFVVQEQAAGAVKFVQAVKGLVDEAVKVSPEASLAWAGVCVLLPLLTNPSAAEAANRDALSYITSRLRYYIEFERILWPDRLVEPRLKAQFESHIVDLYQHMLEFQINTVLQFHRSWLGNLGRNVIRYDDWEGMRQKVEASEEILLKESQMLNLTASEKTLEAMRGEAQLSYQNMKSLLSVAQEQLQVAVQHREIGSEQLAELKRTNRPLDLATVFEARYDSADVQDSPKCESGTRIRIRERIAQWADEGCAEPFFWLVGPAGTGKSTISRTVADTFACQNRLAAGYFFKRGEQGRNDTERLFPTLAMQLAEAIPAFKSCLRESLDGLDREAVQKSSLHAQFGKVLLSPLKRLPHTHASRASIVIIDALDECERPGHLKQVLALLSELAAVNTVRLRVLVTSRPTSAVVAALNGVRHRNLDLESEHRSDTQTDVATFLKQRFASIKNRREILETWPTQAQLDRLIHLSTTPSPLFIYAATLCRFIDDPDERDDPVDQLDLWLHQCDSNIPQLDQIYLPILHHVLFGSYNTNERPRPLQENTRAELFDVLGAVVLAVTPLSYNAIAGLLGISAHKVTSPLRHLQAVLSVPRDPKTPVRLLHKSFSDFLLNSKGPRRCEYAVEAAQTHAMLAAKCIRRMKEGLRRDICGIRKPGMLRDKIDKQVIDTHIPADLQYACLHWVHHLQQGQGSLGGEVDRFLYTHLLHWLEVLALLGKVSDGAAAIKQLLNMCKQMAPGELGEFIKDANKVITTFGSMIEQTPLQIYGALILFSPVSSKVRQRFWDQRPRDICIQGIKSDWDAPDQTYEGHYRLITTVAFSPDNQLVATASWDKTVQLWHAATGICRQTLEGHNGSVNTVAFSPDSQVVVSASSDWTVRLWDAATGKCRQTLKGHNGSINAVAFSPDSRVVASASSDETVRLWDAATGAHRQTLEGHNGQLNAVAFSPDSRVVASASSDKTVWLWDAETGKCLQILEGHNGWVNAVAFSPYSQVVASVSHDKMLRIWDVATGTHRQTLSLGFTQSLAFDPSSSTLLLTDFGAVDLLTNSRVGGSPSPEDVVLPLAACSLGLSPDKTWIMKGREKVIWLPSEYRPNSSAVRGSVMFIGCSTGRVIRVIAPKM